MDYSPYPIDSSSATSMVPAAIQYLPLPFPQCHSYYVPHGVDELLRYPPPRISKYARGEAIDLYETPIQTNIPYILPSPQAGQFVHDTAQYLQGTEQSEVINVPIAGLSQWIQPVQHEDQLELLSSTPEACFSSTTYEPMHSTPSYNAPDALSSNTTYEPTYSTPSDNTAEYDVSMHMAPAYGMSEYMQNIDYLVSNGADTWPYNTSMPAYIPEMPSAHSDTQGMGLLANNDGMPMYGASMGTYAEQRYTSPTCGEPKYSRPTPVAPSDTRDMCMPMSQAPPDNTELCSIPMATQDVGQFVLTSNMLPYDVSMSVDIVSAYDAPLYTGPVPNAQGVMQDMGQLIPSSVAYPTDASQPAPSTSLPREDTEPVEPSSGPMRENRRQMRQKTGSKRKKSKDQRAAADPNTNPSCGNGSGSSTREDEGDGPRQYDACTSWGYARWAPPPEPKQRAGGSCLPCSERAKRCTGKKNSGQPCPECIEKKTVPRCRWEPTLAEVRV